MNTPDPPKQERPLPHSMRTRQPWPMWPIGLAIVAFIAVYTYVNLEFRKEGQAYEPFRAMMERKNAIVEKNMYGWYGLTTTRSEDAAIGPAAIVTSRAYEDVLDALIPEQLKYYMPTRPVLLPGSSKIESPATLTPGQPLRLRLHAPAALVEDERLQLLAFYKEGDLYLLATLFVKEIEEIDPDAFAGPSAPVSFDIPTEPIAAETVSVRFLTEERLAQWEIENLDPRAAVTEDQAEAENTAGSY